MTLEALMKRLIELRNTPGVTGSSPVFVEGYGQDDDFIQRAIASVTTEARCEPDDEPQGVYINLVDEDVDEDDAD